MIDTGSLGRSLGLEALAAALSRDDACKAEIANTSSEASSLMSATP
jgi:hypothetical protein